MTKSMYFLIVVFFIASCGNQESTEQTNNDSVISETENTETKISDEETSDPENDSKMTFFTIENDGIAGLKLGMTLEDIKSDLSEFECEKVIMEIDQIEFFKLTKGGQNICQFELNQEGEVNHVFVGDEYKTKEGIGTLSTVEEVKKKYTLLPYKLVDGAEGMPFVCLTVKELPNLQMWLNVEVPDDYYNDEQKVLANVPESSKIINIYIEK